MEINWNKDIYKDKSNSTEFVSCRIPKKYKNFLKEQEISLPKLIMRACECLDNSLITDD